MIWPWTREEKPAAAVGRRLYVKAVEQARHVAFYRDVGIADTVDGRFDLVVLHVALILRRLKADHARTAETAQALFDVMFADMDENLRELGVGDMGIGRRIKSMAQAFYGRLAAYDAGLSSDDGSLEAALVRNLFRRADAEGGGARSMANYMRSAWAELAARSIDDVLAGTFDFGPPPGPADHPGG